MRLIRVYQFYDDPVFDTILSPVRVANRPPAWIIDMFPDPVVSRTYLDSLDNVNGLRLSQLRDTLRGRTLTWPARAPLGWLSLTW